MCQSANIERILAFLDHCHSDRTIQQQLREEWVLEPTDNLTTLFIKLTQCHKDPDLYKTHQLRMHTFVLAQRDYHTFAQQLLLHMRDQYTSHNLLDAQFFGFWNTILRNIIEDNTVNILLREQDFFSYSILHLL